MTRLCGAPSPAEQRENVVQCQSSCKLSQESHKTQVWLCFLVLSLLSTSTHADSVSGVEDLQTCLEDLKDQIKKSDAMLYAPSSSDIKDHCKKMSLKCYMLELLMVFEEEDIPDKGTHCVDIVNANITTNENCPCEVYPLGNSTIFLDRLLDLLIEMTAKKNANSGR